MHGPSHKGQTQITTLSHAKKGTHSLQQHSKYLKKQEDLRVNVNFDTRHVWIPLLVISSVD